MKTFIEEIQQFLIAEFEKRGVIVYYQIEETHPNIAKLHDKLCVFPEDLTKKDIKTMMQWLEIDTLKLGKLNITWKI